LQTNRLRKNVEVNFKLLLTAFSWKTSLPTGMSPTTSTPIALPCPGGRTSAFGKEHLMKLVISIVIGVTTWCGGPVVATAVIFAIHGQEPYDQIMMPMIGFVAP
jgi:hypothetical protein